jgi:hypothetical protein
MTHRRNSVAANVSAGRLCVDTAAEATIILGNTSVVIVESILPAMSRQPLIYVRRNAKVRVPANALAERPELAALIGECIAFWSRVEAQLAIMLSAIMKAETGITAAVFLSIRNSRAQREALTAAAQVGLKDRELEMFSAIAIVYQSLDSQRTDLAHGLFALSDDLPDALLWIDSKHFTHHHIESLSETRSDSFLGQLAKDAGSEEKLREKFFVYRKDDFISLRDEIKEFWSAVFRFTLFLQMPTSPLVEQEFQKLYTLAPIERALSRLRED